MKSIIDGKRYDTEKAVLIGEYDNGLSSSDFSHWNATLYKTPRSGVYFLAGFGGAMTIYSQRVGDMRSGGSKIDPMTKKGAFEWSEKYLDIDILENEFSDLIKDA